MAGIFKIIRTVHHQQNNAFVTLFQNLLPHHSSQPFLSRTQRCRIPSLTTTRILSSKPQAYTDNDLSNKEPDIGPGTWQEVYRGVLSTQIKLVKTFSLSTSVLGLSVQPVIFQSSIGSHVGLAVAVGSFVGFFTFITPFLIHWISKKYVTALHYDQARDVYVATTLSFFLREKKLEFDVNDVHVPEVPGPFTTLFVRSQPLFLDPTTFSEVEHYGRLMGYNKPVDFHLGSLNKEDEEIKTKADKV